MAAILEENTLQIQSLLIVIFFSFLKPDFHLRIFSREANFSFVFIQLVPHGSS
jgi:hypothetical protein